MIATWLVVAKTKLPRTPLVWDPRLLWTTLALAAIIVLGAIAVAVIDRWRKRAAPPDFDPNDQLAQFRELYEKGELSQQEFDRIRDRLSEKIREELSLPAAPVPEKLKSEGSAGDKATASPAQQTRLDSSTTESGPASQG